jgi:hypothetical protein
MWNHPLLTPVQNRRICTPEHPWVKGELGWWLHPEAVYVRQDDYFMDPSEEIYKCPICGLVFHVEMPE